jgi:hypothetical protein
MISAKTTAKYNPVRTVLDDLGIDQVGEGEVRNLKRLHLTLSLVYAIFVLVSIVLLAMGRGTKVDAGYVFVTARPWWRRAPRAWPRPSCPSRRPSWARRT